MNRELTCWDWNSWHPSIGVDKPLRLSKLEVRWIKSFASAIKRFVSLYPERFEDYDSNPLFETHRRKAFVLWMHKNAENQYRAKKKELAMLLEYRQLIKRRQQLTVVARDGGWFSTFYE